MEFPAVLGVFLTSHALRVLVETDFEASKTLFLKVFRSLKMALTKARLLKHDFPLHGHVTPESSGNHFRKRIICWSPG